MKHACVDVSFRVIERQLHTIAEDSMSLEMDTAKAINPVFNANKLKLGLFGLNGKGSAHTLVPEAYRPTWNSVISVAQTADEAGYEALVAYARWKGYLPDQPAHLSGYVLDPFIFGAVLAQATQYSAIFVTSHAPTVHPIVVARQCASIDLASNGRLALNVVAGWNRPELEMFGAEFREHTDRYQHLSEWLAVVEKLWTDENEFDFSGDFFKLKRAISMPKPAQRHVPIMSAGGSEVGRRFACEHADLCFIILHSEDPEDWNRQITEYKKFAREEYGREVQVWTYAPVVMRETDEKARAYVRHYAVDHADLASVDAWIAGHKGTGKGMSDDFLTRFRMHLAAGGGGIQLIGSAEHIANQLASLSQAGLDGILFTFVDFLHELPTFNTEVLPLLVKRGLRQQ